MVRGIEPYLYRELNKNLGKRHPSSSKRFRSPELRVPGHPASGGTGGAGEAVMFPGKNLLMGKNVGAALAFSFRVIITDK